MHWTSNHEIEYGHEPIMQKEERFVNVAPTMTLNLKFKNKKHEPFIISLPFVLKRNI